MHRRIIVVVSVLLTVAAVAGQQRTPAYPWDLPPGVSAPRLPVGAPMTPARVELGRHLFYDTRLSGNGTQSCATCHIQALAFTDGRPRGLGSTGERHPRSAMSLVNVAYRDALTWGNPTLLTLEEQVLVPLFATDPVELGLAGHEKRVYAALAASPVYRRLFEAAFPRVGSMDDEEQPTEPLVTTERVALALAAFQRSIVSFRSPFDRHRFYGDETALSLPARRGMELFFSRRARCGGCHLGRPNQTHSALSTDISLNLDGGSKTATSPLTEPPVFNFHNTGLYNLPGPVPYPPDNTGRHAHTGDLEHVGQFRIPTLRNVAVTAPYMHDGSIPALSEVLDHYVAGGRAPNPQQSEAIEPLALRDDERQDLIAFLQSLTDDALLRDPRWSDPWALEPRSLAAGAAASLPGRSEAAAEEESVPPR